MESRGYSVHDAAVNTGAGPIAVRKPHPVLAAAAVTPELLVGLSTALHEVATQLADGGSIPPFSDIEGFVPSEDSTKIEPERAWFGDSDIPF